MSGDPTSMKRFTESQGIAIDERTVTIKQLVVGKRALTKQMLLQMPIYQFPQEVHIDDIWGYVRLDAGEEIVVAVGGALFRLPIRIVAQQRSMVCGEEPGGSDLTTGTKERMLKQCDLLIKFCCNEDNQLFIGQ